jgi:hypothetical protein
VLSRFQILPPQLIPPPAAVRRTLNPHILDQLARLAKQQWADNVDAAAALDSALQWLPIPADCPVAEKISRDDNAHDEYFGIQRAAGPATDLFVASVLRANLILYEDSWLSPFTLAPEKLNCLDSALSALILWTLTPRSDAGIQPRIARWKSQDGPHHSMTRWIRGHQIFAALTQGLTAVFTDLRAALQQADDHRAAQAVHLAVLLLNGSAVSLEFTGDFPAADYTQIIRPSMTPPLVPDTFSGLLSVDHRFFIQLLRDMKPLLDSMADHPDGRHQRIASAVASVYDSHRFVCDRLVGKCPSLMMASGSKKSGAEQIEKFKHLRLKVFEPERQAVLSHE